MIQVVIEPISETIAEESNATRESVTIHVRANIVSAATARRAVNGWLLWDVGERVSAGQPELVFSSNPNSGMRWRVPVRWTSPTLGVLVDRVCDIYLSAEDGTLLDPDSKLQEITLHVQRLARAIHSSNS
jgi:hypothetical protein